MKVAVPSVIAVDSRNADKGAEPINSHTHAYIAYIAGRLISGKRIATLYDYSRTRHIAVTELPDIRCIREFDALHRDYIPGYSSGCRYQYPCGNGHTIDLCINGNSFVGRFMEISTYFVGNVRGDAIYIFDHEDSAHVNYRISGCLVEKDNTSAICTDCWLTR
jgi:hypothetical protein